jgi:hypothetical protein
MAKNYDEIKALVNQGNQMGLSNTIKRDYGIPLDYSSVQETYEAALAYAQTSTLAYIGQPISVGDTLYIVTDEANGFLKAVGTKPTGDEQSITIKDDGKIAIKGFEAAGDATLPQKQADGSIKWVAISALVEGDGNTKTVVNVADDSALTISDVYDEVNDTYTYTLDVALPAIPVYTIVKDETVEGQVTYKLTKDDQDEGTAIVVPKAYDDTSLVNRVTELEVLKDSKADTEHTHIISDVAGLQDAIDTAEENAKSYTDSEIKDLKLVISKEDAKTYISITDSADAEISKVDASVFVKDSFLDDVVYDAATGKVTFTWKMADESTKTDEIDIADLVDTYTAGTGIKIENNVVSVDNTIATKQDILDLGIEDYAKAAEVVANDVFESFKEENTDAIAVAKQEAIDAAKTAEEAKGYATETVVDTKISDAITAYEANADAKYLVESDLDSLEASVAAAAVKADVDEALALKADVEDLNNYYKKSETYSQEEVNELLDGIQAGSSESAASVKTQLDSYKKTNDERVDSLEANDAIQDSAIAENTSIIELLTKTDGTEGSIKKTVDDAVKNLADGQVATNKEDINALNKALESANAKVSEIETDLETETSERNQLAGIVSGHTSDITILGNKDKELSEAIQANTDKFADYSTTEEVNAAIETAINAIDYTELNEKITANTENLEAETLRATAAEEANAALIAKIVGEDTDKSARNIAKEEVAAVVASAPEAFDTLKEIADWIKDDQTGAAAMSAAITENTTAISILNGDGEGSVNKKIAEAINKIPVATESTLGLVKASEEVTVAEDGKMSINKVSTDLLVQGNEELVLNGGTATK